MRVSYVHRGESVTLDVEQQPGGLSVRLPDSSEQEIGARFAGNGLLEIEHANRTLRIPYARTTAGIQLSFEGRIYEFTPHTPGQKKEAEANHSGELAAPMAGAVADVLVKTGDTVAAYQPLVVIEAMKVLATVESPHAGTVTRLHVAKGDRVEHGASLVDLTPASHAR